MSVENDDDRLAVLEDFGVDVEVKGRVIIAVFDDGFLDSLGSWVTTPILTVRTKDVADVDRGDTMNINNVAYTLSEKQPDGQGMTNVILQKT